MTFGSLFSGIGGIDLGLERAGLECRWQVENDPFCTEILERHWPHVKRYGDIRKIDGSELEPVDLVCGGFPCQDLSQAGKRYGIEGTRSGLWAEFARLVGQLRPGWVVVENVPGILVHDAMRRVIGDLARYGYVGWWRCLRAADFGAAHLRKRIFIVAHTGHSERWPTEPSGFDWPRPSNHDCGTSGALDYTASGNRRPFAVEPELRSLECGSDAPLRFAPGPADSRWPAILTDHPDLAPALESPVHGVADGIPDWLERAMRDRTKRLGRLGNAVVPQVAEWIGRKILEIAK